MLPCKKRKSYTIIGSISNERNRVITSVIDSTNKKQVLKYLGKLREGMVNPKRTLIVMDNHCSHHSKVVTKYL